MKYGEKSWKYTYADLGFTANTEELAAKAYEVGRSGDVKQRYEALARLSSAKVDFEMTDQYDTAKLEEIITEIKEELDQPAKDATITLESGKFVIRGRTGGIYPER
ncbi:MAG: peptidoglycan binding domain-containing protein [Clostridia bacterium]